MSLRRRLASALLVLLALFAGCASPPPAGVLGQPEGSGKGALSQQLAQLLQRDAQNGPRTVFIGVSLYGSEGVFDRDMALLDRLFAERFGSGYRSLRFSNRVLLAGDRELPLALPPQLASGLKALAHSHRPGDRYLVLLASHGHRNQLAVHQPALRREVIAWGATDIAKLLDPLPADAPTWLIVSACHSGSLIPVLKAPNRLVMAAAHEDQPSFGCGDQSPNTWFVRELHDALAQQAGLQEAWARLLERIAEREQAMKYAPSRPQWEAGRTWQPKLAAPWVGF